VGRKTGRYKLRWFQAAYGLPHTPLRGKTAVFPHPHCAFRRAHTTTAAFCHCFAGATTTALPTILWYKRDVCRAYAAAPLPIQRPLPPPATLPLAAHRRTLTSLHFHSPSPPPDCQPRLSLCVYLPMLVSTPAGIMVRSPLDRTSLLLLPIRTFWLFMAVTLYLPSYTCRLFSSFRLCLFSGLVGGEEGTGRIPRHRMPPPSGVTVTRAGIRRRGTAPTAPHWPRRRAATPHPHRTGQISCLSPAHCTA